MQQFIRFCIVGGIATVLDACLYLLFMDWMSYQASMVLSYTICLCLNMLATLRWTFRTRITFRSAAAIVFAHVFNIFVVRYKLMMLFVVTMHMDERIAYFPTLGISVEVNYYIIKAILNNLKQSSQ